MCVVDLQTSDARGNLPAFWWISDSGAELKWSFSELADKSKRWKYEHSSNSQ